MIRAGVSSPSHGMTADCARTHKHPRIKNHSTLLPRSPPYRAPPLPRAGDRVIVFGVVDDPYKYEKEMMKALTGVFQKIL